MGFEFKLTTASAIPSVELIYSLRRRLIKSMRRLRQISLLLPEQMPP